VCKQEVSWRLLLGNLHKRDHLEDPSVDGRITFSGSGMGDMDWIDLA
jgi:hypothetical protein